MSVCVSNRHRRGRTQRWVVYKQKVRSKATWRQRSKGQVQVLSQQVRGIKYQVTDAHSLSIIGTSGLSCPADEEESGGYIKCYENWRQGSIISSSVYSKLEQRQTHLEEITARSIIGFSSDEILRSRTSRFHFWKILKLAAILLF